MGGAVKDVARATCARLGLVVPLRYFFFSYCVSVKTIDCRKILVRFEFRKVPET